MSNNFKFVSNHRPRTAAANNFNKTTLRGVAGTSTAATYRQPHTWGGLGPVAVNVPVNRIIYNKPGRVEGGRGSLYTASPVYTYPQGRRHLSDGVTCGHTLFLPSVLPVLCVICVKCFADVLTYSFYRNRLFALCLLYGYSHRLDRKSVV
jgi:hypothetical protein